MLGYQKRARDLAMEAMTAFNLFQNRTTQKSTEAREYIRSFFDKSVQNLHLVTSDINQKRLRGILHENRAYITNLQLLNATTWAGAGFEILGKHISTYTAREIITSIILESFRLRDDTKKDFLIANGGGRNEAKTRKHIRARTLSGLGDILGSSIPQNDPISDSLIVLQCNLASLPSILSDIEELELQLNAWNAFFNSTKNPFLILQTLGKQIDSSNSYETVNELAYRIASLEAKTVTNKVDRMVGNVKFQLRDDVLKQKNQMRNDIMIEDMGVDLRKRLLENDLKMQRTRHKLKVEAILTSVTTFLESAASLLDHGVRTSR